jgi:hypothetical protein
MYRKFYLKNGVGNTFALTDKNFNYFMESPQGLGFQKTVNGYTLGNVTKVTSSSYNFMTISGELLFYSERENAYQEYFDFVNFISFEPLQLFYLPPNTLTPYYCDIELTQADKSEYNKDGMLHVPLSMQMTSRWLSSEETVIELSKTFVGDGKHYDLERPYYYAGNSLSNVEITNTGSEDIGMIIEINGDITNPQWTFAQNSVVYGSCKINGTYDYVKVNSQDGEQSIYLENEGSIIANPTVYQDLSITGGVLTFIKLKTGTSIFSFTSGNIDDFNGTIKIRFSNSYVSV